MMQVNPRNNVAIPILDGSLLNTLEFNCENVVTKMSIISCHRIIYDSNIKD